MSLGVKSLLILAVVSVLAAFAEFSLLGRMLLPAIEEAEATQAKGLQARLTALVAAERRDLADFAEDWARWRETGAYLARPQADYPQGSLVQGTLLSEDVDIFGLYASDGSLLWGAIAEQRLSAQGYDLEGLDRALVQGFDPKGGTSRVDGDAHVIDLDGMPAFLAVRPVVHEDYGNAVVGYLALFRVVDGDMIARWRRLSAAPTLAIEATGEADDEATDVTGLRVALAPESDGKFWLQLEPEVRLSELRSRLRDVLTYTLAIGALAFFALYLAWRRWLLAGLINLTRNLLLLRHRDSSGASQRLPVSGSDEVAIITGEVNELLDSLEKAASQTGASADATQTVSGEHSSDAPK